MKYVQFLVLFAAPGVWAGAELFPLETGNTWRYRNAATGAVVTVEVGERQEMGGVVYHRLSGYATDPLSVRHDSSGLVYRDEAANRDVLLLAFEGAFEAPRRMCASRGSGAGRKSGQEVPAGRFPAVEVVYSGMCADAGVTRELFAENIGMIRREESSIAGPWVFDLVAARVGNLAIATDPAGQFTLALESPRRARLTLRNTSAKPLSLEFLSGQEFDLDARDALGNSVWHWSSNKLFIDALHSLEVSGEKSWTVDLSEADLRPGTYTLSAWLTDRAVRKITASVPWELKP